MRTADCWLYLCDRCRAAIRPERPDAPSASLEAMRRAGRLFVRRGSKGRTLHYCSAACLAAHFRAGRGTPPAAESVTE